jgi:hypothetical protein
VAQADKGGDSQSKPAATGSAAATKKSGSS